MEKKLQPSEMHVMEVVWERGALSAKDIAAILAETVGWSKTTTYTVIGKCVDKGALRRTEPGFLCEAAITREEVRDAETGELIRRFWGNSPDALVASLVSGGKLTKEELSRLRALLGEKR